MEEDVKKNEKDIEFERRRFPRLNTSVDIEYTILDKPFMHEEKSQTKNISVDGICLIIYEEVELGSLLDLQIYLADIDYTIKVKGKVVWSSYFSMTTDTRTRYDTGIEFIEMNEPDCQKVSQYIFTFKK